MLITAWKIGLGPVLALQGKRVRRTALRLPEASGPRNGITGYGAPLRLLLIGDSSACGVGVQRQEDAFIGALVRRFSRNHRVYWRVIAKSGATTRDMISRVSRAAPEPFDLIVTSLGVNDVTDQVPVRRWLKQQRDLHDVLRDRFGGAHIYASGMPPIVDFPALPRPLNWFLGLQGRAFDRIQRLQLAACDHATHVQLEFPRDASLMAEDGYHPTSRVYDMWAGWVHDAHAARNARPASQRSIRAVAQPSSS